MALARATKGIFIVGAKRTPFGAYGGKLANLTATDLQEVAARAALQSANINPELINSCIIGNVSPTSNDTPYMARHTALRVGMRVETPCFSVNRLCGSGFQSVISGAQEITSGDCEIVLTGGSESMSQSPHTLRGVRFAGVKLGQDLVLQDAMWAVLTDMGIKTPMGVTAENLAEKFDITRQQADEFAIQSQQRWLQAQEAGRFADELVPVEIKSKKGTKIVDVDEHPKPQTTLEQISKLPPVFKKDGTVTAANASGICDGAGAVILASEDAVNKHNLTPLARLAGYSVSGCDPKIMGIGPVPAIENLLKATNLTLDNIDMVDVNEAFAPQFLAVQKALGLDPAKTNQSGGAIALGHPVGASGSRITAHLAYQIRNKDVKYAIGSACIGGGQGIALLLEKCN